MGRGVLTNVCVRRYSRDAQTITQFIIKIIIIVTIIITIIIIIIIIILNFLPCQIEIQASLCSHFHHLPKIL